MDQIFCIGASSVYGVGGETGGWADMIKQHFHQKMYSAKGVGDKFEVFNFGKSGAQINFVLNTLPQQIKDYGRDGKIITIISAGGNNIKAKNTADNFVSTLEEYSNQMSELLDMAQKLSTHVIIMGSGYYDEKKTTPKTSPFDGSKSFFFNERKKLFENKLRELCDEWHITFLDLDIDEKTWTEKYLHKDGLHANKAGHEYITKKIISALDKYID